MSPLAIHSLALVGEMVTKHGQAFKTNYTIKRGFHVTLMIPNRAVTFDFPAEIEVVSFNFVGLLRFDENSFSSLATNSNAQTMLIVVIDFSQSISWKSNGIRAI